MSEKKIQKLLKDLQQLKEENNAWKVLCNHKTAENEKLNEKLHSFEWMLIKKQTAAKEYVADYGDLSLLNNDGLIKNSIQKDQLYDIVSEYLDVLETSSAIYEKNGDYAMGIFSSGWCQMMDSASRSLCNTDDNRKALASGKWLCHDSCWTDASLKSMNEGKPVEVPCNGGINLYAVPVWANKQIIGAINFGFGSPPKDDAELKKLSKTFKIPIKELKEHSTAYNDRPQFIIDYAKKRIQNSARYLGYLVERKLAEDTVRQNEEKLKSIFRVAPTGIGVLINRIFTEVNPKVCEMTGYRSDELVGQSARILYPTQEEYEFVGQEKYKQIAKHGTGSVETLWQRKDGKIIDVLLSSTPVDSDNLLKGVTFTALDISNRKEAEMKLAESEARYRKILESAPVGIAIHQRDKIVFVNPEGLRMIGADSSEQIIGKEIVSIIHPDNLDELRKRKQRMINGEHGLYPAEDKYVRLDGEVIDVEVMATSLTYENEPAVQVIFTDITERKRMLEELIAVKEKAEESDKLKTAFLQNMSHEIRTPLNSIIGFSERLNSSKVTKEKRQFYTDIIIKSGFQLLSVVSDILVISSIDTGQEQLNKESVCINTLISEVETIFKQQIDGKRVKLKTKKPIPKADAKILTDKTKLTQILTNLISNAIKFTPVGEIEFGYSIKNNELVFFVKDNGIGIDRSKHEIIFERFVQAEESIVIDYGGTGLGLSICKGFVELLGGKIWVESELGKGAKFYFTVPIK